MVLSIRDHDNEPPLEHPQRKRHSVARDIVEIAIVALIIYVAISHAVQTVRVDGESMLTTLNNNDLLLALKFGDPQRGEIVILTPPVDPNQVYVKRVIGMPGDQIEIDGNNGQQPAHVFIKVGGQGDPQQVNEPYVNNEPWVQPPGAECCDPNAKPGASITTMTKPTWVTIPAGHYFVMGDNRNHSEDSRYFGFVARDKIQARVMFRIWPLGHFSLGTGPTLIPAASGAIAFPLWFAGARPLRRRVTRRRRSPPRAA